MDHKTTNRLMRLSEVQRLTALPKSSIYHLMKQNDFPQPLKLSKRTVAWKESDVLEWIESREKVAKVEEST